MAAPGPGGALFYTPDPSERVSLLFICLVALMLTVLLLADNWILVRILWY